MIILGGANDAYEGVSLSHAGANFTAMVEISSRYGIIPILGLPTPSLLPSEEKFLTEYRNWLKDYAGREKMTVIDFYTPFQRAIQAGGADKLYYLLKIANYSEEISVSRSKAKELKKILGL
ncbi:hypothetical protein SDC9_198098 [bioreactor metagenome]|uniref:SGNH hydrolase-type esterase domain-containing protein n=1 Tax=bioreactor metagenome TaxID=1076179 RepID=A0A645IGP6_9ZZZZ